MAKTNGSKSPAAAAVAASVVRTSAGLRDALFDELDALRRGEIDPKRANAVAKLAKTVVETVRMEIEVVRQGVSLKPGKRDGKLSLGSPLPLS